MLTALGAAIGALIRFAPELLKFFDKKDERKHEAAMFDKQNTADQLRAQSQQKLEETKGENALSLADVQALIAATNAQAAPVQLTGNKILDFLIGASEVLSKTVRPVLTYWWCVVLYTAAMACEFYGLVWVSHQPAWQAMLQIFGPEEKALCAAMFSFWFVDRTMKHMRRGT